MFPVESLDAAATLRHATETLHRRRDAEVDDLRLVAHWADLHGHLPTPAPGAAAGGDRLVTLGGAGTPKVRELPLAELAIARRSHCHAARSVTADVLDLQHRLPKVWAQLLAGQGEVWVARRVAKLTRPLAQDTCRVVDAAVARMIGTESPGRTLTVAEAKIIEADPVGHMERLERARHRKFVTLSRVSEDGLRMVIARVDAGDAAWIDAVVDRVADLIAPQYSEEVTRDELRADAFGYLARPAELLAMLVAANQEAADAEAEAAHEDALPDDQDQPNEDTTRARSTPGEEAAEPGADGTPEPASRHSAADDPTGPAPTQDPALVVPADGGAPAEDEPGDVRDAKPGPTPGQAPTGADIEPVDPGEPVEDPEPIEPTEPYESRATAFPADLLDALRSWDPRQLLPKSVLYLHLCEEAVHGVAAARVEGLGPMLLDQVAGLLRHSHVVVKPVIDLVDRISVNAYEIPESVRERIMLTMPGDYFPYATTISRNVDLDHVTPYDEHGPPGQTGTHNTGPLTRQTHRAKTHGGYQVVQTAPAQYVWRTPHGCYYLSDHTGTIEMPFSIGNSIFGIGPGHDMVA